jgi:hypothetical protein
MAISFLYRRISRVYYAFMGLGTTETVSSIALAMVPPGNVIRAIAEIRRAFWAELGAASGQAYFDFPVIAWLSRPMEGSDLAGLASRSPVPFSLAGFHRRGDDVFLRFHESALASVEELAERLPSADGLTDFSPGPFSAGLGCYCASLPSVGESALPGGILGAYPQGSPSVKAKTCVLAQIELSWVPGPSFASSWASISSARLAETRGTA